jgi:hypothetical protein
LSLRFNRCTTRHPVFPTANLAEKILLATLDKWKLFAKQ